MPEKQSSNRKRKIPKTAFKKGQSGNPNGRPKKGLAIADILNELLDAPADNKTRREVILEKVIELATGGEKWAIEFVADRTEGKAIERVVKQKVKDEIVIE